MMMTTVVFWGGGGVFKFSIQKCYNTQKKVQKIKLQKKIYKNGKASGDKKKGPRHGTPKRVGMC